SNLHRMPSTANKGPIVHALCELAALAHEKRRGFFAKRRSWAACRFFRCFHSVCPRRFCGDFPRVLNSTNNVVLTEIEKGRSFHQAVKRTKAIGVGGPARRTSTAGTRQ